MSNPISPVTGHQGTTLVDSFASNDIIRLYQQQLGMDVSRFFSNTAFDLYACNQTGYRFYHPQGMDGDGPFYSELQQKLGDGYYHDWKFENQLAFDAINAGDHVLDIGCGVGKFLERAKEKAASVVGLELNEKAVDVCRAKGLNVKREFIADHAAANPGQYDMVTLFQVLEHIYDIRGFLSDALKALKPGGKLLIGVPNNEPYFQSYDKYCTLNLPPHHMGLWNKEVFEKMAPLFGLTIQQVAYDVTGSIKVEAYLRAKYLAGVKTPAGRHTQGEKLKMAAWGLISVPLSLIKKFTRGINGSHIAVLFQKK